MGEMSGIHGVMSAINEQVLELVQGNSAMHREGYQSPTRFTKMDIPKFMKDDMNDSISK